MSESGMKRSREENAPAAERPAKRPAPEPSKASTRRALRGALSRYARIGQSALACVQRGQVLLRRVEAQCASVGLVLGSMPMPAGPPQSAGFGGATSAAAAARTRSQLVDLMGLGQRKPRPSDLALRFDAEGRAVDAAGHVLSSDVGATRSVKANAKLDAARAPKKVNPYAGYRLDAADVSDVVDPRVVSKKRESKKDRAFAFVKEGHYVKIAEATRARELSSRIATVSRPEALDNDDGASAGGSDDDVSVGAAPTGPRLPPRSEHYASIPGMEWWDEEFLGKDRHGARAASIAERMRDEYESCALEKSRYHGLVHHPASARPLGGEGKKVATMPFYLTAKDRKRVRRQTRAEREREKQDKIQLGLVAPPEPKFKLSNFMKVLGEQAVADPSKMERKVMEQVTSRLTKHAMRNAARKLTPQEKKEKKRRKLAEDTSAEVSVAVFYVASLESSQHRFKIDVNAQQLSLTGGVLICSAPDASFALVVVEGGPRAIKRFAALVNRRIDWADDAKLQAETTAFAGVNWAAQVWAGSVVKRAFTAFRFQECKSSLTARRVLDAKGVAHYWDMVLQAHEAGPPPKDDDDDED